jgi:hypothetical protein
MPRLKSIALAVFIAILVLLPLYEFADIGEQWPNDGEVVVVVFTTMFIGAALLACRGWAGIRLASRPRAGGVAIDRTSARQLSVVRYQPFLFLILCAFRI